MTTQTFLPYSFGSSFVDGSSNVKALFSLDQGPLQARRMDPVEASIVGLGDRTVRAQPKASTWTMNVRLASSSETSVQAMYAVFSEELGQQYLVATDGDGNQWRVQARVIAIEQNPGTKSRFVVTVRVADPRWEENTPATSTASGMSGGGSTLTPSNAGTRVCQPTLTVTPNSVKTDCVDDWKYSYRGVMVNPSPNRFSGPVWLFDQLNVAARLSTTTLVKDTTVSNLVNQGGGITSSATTIPIDTPAGGGLPARGMAAIDNEQIYYTANSGSSLTGVVRGVGGTVTAAHADNAVVYKSESLADGGDVAVWVDGERVSQDNVFPVAWNTSASDVVINTELEPSIVATCSFFQQYALGASDTTIRLHNAGNADALPDSGFLLVRRGGSGAAVSMEVIYYAARSGPVLSGCIRGLWGTTGTAINNISQTQLYLNPHRIVVATGRAIMREFNDNTYPRRPCCQLVGGSNQTWKYGDDTDDPATVFVDPSGPDRTAQWVFGWDTDGNDSLGPLVGSTVSTTYMEFSDRDIGENVSPYNQITLELSQGTASSGNLVADWTPAQEVLNLEEWGRDARGTWKLLDQLQQAAAAAGRTRALTSKLYALKLKARYNVVTGAYLAVLDGTTGFNSLTNTVDTPTADATVGQIFVLDKPTWIKGWQFFTQKNPSLLQNIKTAVYPDNGGQPLVGNSANGYPGELAGGATQAGILTGATTTYGLIQTLVGSVLAPAGKYHLLFWEVTPHNLSLSIAAKVAPTLYAKGLATFVLLPGSHRYDLTNTVLDFRILSDYSPDLEASINDDQPMRDPVTGARTGITARFDKVVIPLSQYPYVHRTGGFTNGLYHHAAVITNTDTGQSLATDVWSKTGSPLVLDCANHTAVLTEDGFNYSVLGGVVPSDSEHWIGEQPGTNHLQYAEANLVSTTFGESHRGVKT